jgi:hypothetical protein
MTVHSEHPYYEIPLPRYRSLRRTATIHTVLALAGVAILIWGAAVELLVGQDFLVAFFVAMFALALSVFFVYEVLPIALVDRFAIYEDGLVPFRKRLLARRGRVLRLKSIERIELYERPADRGFAFVVFGRDGRRFTITSDDLETLDFSESSRRVAYEQMDRLRGLIKKPLNIG